MVTEWEEAKVLWTDSQGERILEISMQCSWYMCRQLTLSYNPENMVSLKEIIEVFQKWSNALVKGKIHVFMCLNKNLVQVDENMTTVEVWSAIICQ